MTEPGTPESPAPAAQPPPLPRRLEIEEVSQTKRKWFLELHPDHFALHSEFEPRPWVFTRAEMWDKVALIPGMGLLTVRAPRGVGFKLGREGLAAFKQWLGPPTPESLRAVLKKRFSDVWISALLLIGISVPTLRSGLDSVGLALGLLLCLVWIWGMSRPARIHFLLYGAWYLVSGGYLLLQVVNGRSKFLLGLTLLWFLMAWRGFRWFIWFSAVKTEDTQLQKSPAA